jgi:hypothetical protein
MSLGQSEQTFTAHSGFWERPIACVLRYFYCSTVYSPDLSAYRKPTYTAQKQTRFISTRCARPRATPYLIDQITFPNATSPCRPTTTDYPPLGMPPTRPPDRTQMSRFSCASPSPCLPFTVPPTTIFSACFIAVQQAWRCS